MCIVDEILFRLRNFSLQHQFRLKCCKIEPETLEFNIPTANTQFHMYIRHVLPVSSPFHQEMKKRLKMNANQPEKNLFDQLCKKFKSICFQHFSLCSILSITFFSLSLHCLQHFVECVNSFNPILIHITRIAIPFLALTFVECSSSNPIIYQPFCCCLFSFKVFHLCSFGAFISSFFLFQSVIPALASIDSFMPYIRNV